MATKMLAVAVALVALASAQAQAPVDCGKIQADLIFLVDESGSVGDANFQKQRDFLKQFVQNFDIGPNAFQVGVTTFSSGVTKQFALSDYDNATELMQAIDAIPYGGGVTNTHLGLDWARTTGFTPANGDRPGVPNILVTLTDGQSTNPNLLTTASDALHKTNIDGFAIGIGSNVNQNELEQIAGTAKHVYNAASFDALNSILGGLKNTTCQAVVEAPQTNCGRKPADIHFLIDASGSVGQDNFQKQLDWIKSFVSNFRIGPHDVRVGLTTFSGGVQNEFFTNTYNNKQDLLNAINNVTYTSQVTRTDLGLEFVRQQAFTAAHGDRPNAANILIVTTDGQSTNPNATANQAALLHSTTNINTFALGIGSNVNTDELKVIASDPSHVFTVSGFDALDNISKALEDTACTAVVQEPEGGCASNGGKADIHFLLDSSGSVGSAAFQKQLAFVENFANGFQIGPNAVQVGVTTFSNLATNQFYMNEHHDKQDLLNAIKNINYIPGSTHTELGLEFVRDQAFTVPHGDRPGVANILVVVTDGQSTVPTATQVEADELHKLNINVMTVGVGGGVDQQELQMIASDPANVFTVSDFDALNNIKQQLEDTTCGKANNSRCNAPIDLVFVVDKSASIHNDQYLIEKEFIEKMVDQFHISPSEVQVAVTLFANHVRPKWCFNNYTTQQDVVAAVANLSCPECHRGKTGTGEAMQYVVDHVLKTECGSRPNAQKVVVVLTDGHSTERPHSIVTNAAQKLQRTGATVIAVGVGHVGRGTELHEIATADKYVFTAQNFDQLLPLLNEVAASACTAVDFSRTCNAQMDLTFLVDHSRTINGREFTVEEDFIEQLVSKFNIQRNGVHTALATFSNSVQKQWCFNDYMTQNQVITAIQNMSTAALHGSHPNDAIALQWVRQQALTPQCGARPNVTKTVIVLTDGRDNHDMAETQKQADLLKAMGVNIITVGVGRFNHSRLEMMATNHSYVFAPSDFSHLMPILEQITDAVCDLAPTHASGAPGCAAQQQDKACAILTMHNRGKLNLSDAHADSVTPGNVDHAMAVNNIKDMCRGQQAHRSRYKCEECAAGSPGGSICLSNYVLDYVTALAANGTLAVNELAGGCYGCNSAHYSGMAVTVSRPGDTQSLMDACTADGGTPQDLGSSVRCVFT